MVDLGVVELRRYALKPGRRDDLIALFDREFLESQEAVGATVLGQFCDLDDPDRFVWLRGFADMPGRRAALEAFYGGPVWHEHRGAANDTMIAWDDVLLLEPVGALHADTTTRPRIGAPAPGSEFWLTIHPAGVAVPDSECTLRTLHAENDFPALPVRTDADVVVHLTPKESAPHVPGGAERVRLSPTGRSWLR